MESLRFIFHRLVFIILVLASIQANSQCPYDNTIGGSCPAPSTLGGFCYHGGIQSGEYERVTGMIAGYTYRIFTCQDITFDTQLTIYPAGGGTSVDYNDDYCGLQSQIEFIPSTSGDYDILIDEYNCNNSSISSALAIGLSDDLSGTPNITVIIPDNFFKDLWQAGTSLKILWNDNISENVMIELFKGGSFYTIIINSTSSDGSYSWYIPTSLPNCYDYQVKITSTTNSSLYDISEFFAVNSTASLNGENCSNPLTITGTSGSVNYTTTCYNDDYFGSCMNNTAEDIVYYLSSVVPIEYTLEFWTSADNYDVVLYGRRGSCMGAEIGCVNDPDGTLLSWVNNTGTSQNVWLFVDGWNISDGSATLNWNIVPPSSSSGEDCSNPITITGTSGSVNYTTTGYINDYQGSGGGTGEDKVYYLSTAVPNGNTLEFWTTADNYNVVLYGRRGSCTGTEIAWLNDPDGTLLTWNNNTGISQNIWFFVDGWSGSDGSATLNWNMVPTGIENIDFINNLSIHPNPNTGEFIIEMEITNPQDLEIKLLNVIGQVIYKEKLIKFSGAYQKTIDAGKQATGIYNLQILTENGIINKKLIIN